jgi:hypothetical protein
MQKKKLISEETNDSSLAVAWGRCYEHTILCESRQFSAKKLALFLNQSHDTNFAKTSSTYFVQKASIFRLILRRKYFDIITSVTGLPQK